MKGTHRVVVSNNHVKYEFQIRRNITIIRGDSATGKTTLVEMINDYYESGENSGIDVICDKQCRVISGRDWNAILNTIYDSIVFIDEDNDFLPSNAFSEAVKKSDNYYVIVTREGLPNLPYSVEEIYGIKSSGKYMNLKQVYHEFFHIYGLDDYQKMSSPDVIIVEDANSGFEFFSAVSRENSTKVISANGKSNIFKMLHNYEKTTVLVIADGAAFGSEMDRLSKLYTVSNNVSLFLPESFEWLILSSGILKNTELESIIESPSEYIESSEYFSWERFFTALIIRLTKDTYMKYSKKKLNPFYLHERNKKMILSMIKNIDL